jgi:hypothetical protein
MMLVPPRYILYRRRDYLLISVDDSTRKRAVRIKPRTREHDGGSCARILGQGCDVIDGAIFCLQLREFAKAQAAHGTGSNTDGNLAVVEKLCAKITFARKALFAAKIRSIIGASRHTTAATDALLCVDYNDSVISF